jgi:excisionase family DNA binding protein
LPEPGPPLLPLAVSIREAGRLLRLSRATIYRLINKGKLRAVKCGNRTLVPLDGLRRLLDDPPSV